RPAGPRARTVTELPLRAKESAIAPSARNAIARSEPASLPRKFMHPGCGDSLDYSAPGRGAGRAARIVARLSPSPRLPARWSAVRRTEGRGRRCPSRDALRFDDPLEAQPRGHLRELRLQARNHVGVAYSGLEMKAAEQEGAGGAIGFQVHARDQPIAEEEGQHVVPVHPLMRGRVEGDAVMEGEEPL